jgi:hypothetical protein
MLFARCELIIEFSCVPENCRRMAGHGRVQIAFTASWGHRLRQEPVTADDKIFSQPPLTERDLYLVTSRTQAFKERNQAVKTR